MLQPTTLRDRPLRALGWYLAGCAALTLGPLPRLPLDLLVSVTQAGARLVGTSGSYPTHPQVEGVANVLLVVPIGFLLGRASPRCPRVWLLAIIATGSAAIELAQHVVLTGRYSSGRDIALNTAGAAIGLLIAGRRSTEEPGPAPS